jgi:hypothetical protein
MGRPPRCWGLTADRRVCRGKVLNAYVREGTPSKWRVVGRVCNVCYVFEPASRSAGSSGAASGAGSAGSSA